MTAILVFSLFVTFLLIELFTREKTRKYIFHPSSRTEVQVQQTAPVVAGYEVPTHLRFHPGHAWAQSESPNLIRTGIDEFAAKLIGEAHEVNLPQCGQWIRQGQKIWSFRTNGELMEMVSPIEGTVCEVNREVIRHPETLTADPYGESWLMTVQSPDAKTNFRNLLGGSMARSFIADSAKRLARYASVAHGDMALAQDGGMVHGEISKHLDPEKYAEIAREFFLT